MSTSLNENSMFSDATGRAALVANPKLCTELFFINFLGFIGLYALNDSRGYMKAYETSEKRLKINEIADDNHDVSLIVKLCVEAGTLSEALSVPVTKLLALIKQRSVRAKDIDDQKIRDMIAHTMLANKPMDAQVKSVVVAFTGGTIGVKEFSRQIYDVSKKNAWRDYTLEFRNLILKGQYTDYFSAMKKAAANGTVAAPSAPTPVATPAPAKPSAPKLTASSLTVQAIVPHFARALAKDWKAVNGAVIGMAAISAFTDAAKAMGVDLNQKAGAAWTPKLTSLMVEAIPLAVAAITDAEIGSTNGGTTYLGWSGRSHHESLIVLQYAMGLRLAKWAKSPDDWSNVNIVADADQNRKDWRDVLVIMKDLAVKWPVPTSEKEFDAWKCFAVNLKSKFTQAEITAMLAAKIDPKGNARTHNMHFEMLVHGQGHTRLMDASEYGPAAMTWIRKYGAENDVTFQRREGLSQVITALRPSTALTRKVWEEMRSRDQMVWLAQNFNEAGVKKATSFFRAGRVEPKYLRNASDDVTAEQCSKHLGNLWKDDAYVNSMYRQAYDFSPWWDMLCVVAVHNIKKTWKPEQIPAMISSRIASGIRSYSNQWDEAMEVVMRLVAMPATTAAEVLDIIAIAKMLGGDSDNLLLPDRYPTFDATLEMPASNFHVIAFSSARRDSKAGVLSSDNTSMEFDSAGMASSNKEFIEKFGGLYKRSLKMAPGILGKEDATDAIAAMFIAEKDIGKSIRVPHGLVQEMSNWGTGQWDAAIRRMVASGKYPNIFTTYSQYGKTGYVIGEYARSTPSLFEAARTYVMNNYSVKEIEGFDSGYVSITNVRAPLDAGKVALLEKETIKQLNYYGSAVLSSVEQSIIFELLEDGIKKGLLGANAPKYTASLFGALDGRSPYFVKVVDTVYSAKAEEFRPSLAVALAQRFSLSSHLIPADVMPAWRWAFGFTSAEMAEAVEKAKGLTNYVPLTVPVDLLKDSPNMPDDVKAALKSSNYGQGVPHFTAVPWVADFTDAQIGIDATMVSSPMTFRWAAEKVVEMDDLKPRLVAALKVFEKPFPANWDSATIYARHAKYLIDMVDKIDPTNDVAKKNIAEWVLGRLVAAKSKPAEFVDFIADIDPGVLSTDSLAALVKKFASTDSKGSMAALASMAYEKGKATVSKRFIEAVRAAGVERAVVGRLAKSGEVVGAVDVLNADPHAIKISIDQNRAETFLKYNDIDLSKISVITATKLEDFGTAAATVRTRIPGLAVSPIVGAADALERTRTLHRANRYNHNPAVGLEVKKVYAVNIPKQRERFDEWTKANPAAKVMTLYHGSGTINAAFILRFGFKIIKSTDSSVTGRMLGDGIYFADNINKTMLYMSNAGYIRQANQEGFVFKCKVALGKTPKDYREGAQERRNLVSNEWSIMSTDQIVIEEAYYGFSREQKDLKTMLNEEVGTSRALVSSFMFMDGMIPIDADLIVDFEKMPDFGAHVTIETSAKGPIVNIRHDTTFKPVNRCYRYGEELQGRNNELAVFIKLLRNRY